MIPKTKLYCVVQFHLSYSGFKKIIKDEAAEILEISNEKVVVLLNNFNLDSKITKSNIVDAVTISYIRGNNARLTLCCKVDDITINDITKGGTVIKLIPPLEKKLVLPNGESIILKSNSLEKITNINKGKNVLGRKAQKSYKEKINE